jgi:hypothetical protein
MNEEHFIVESDYDLITKEKFLKIKYKDNICGFVKGLMEHKELEGVINACIDIFKKDSEKNADIKHSYVLKNDYEKLKYDYDTLQCLYGKLKVSYHESDKRLLRIRKIVDGIDL